MLIEFSNIDFFLALSSFIESYSPPKGASQSLNDQHRASAGDEESGRPAQFLKITQDRPAGLKRIGILSSVAETDQEAQAKFVVVELAAGIHKRLPTLGRRIVDACSKANPFDPGRCHDP